MAEDDEARRPPDPLRPGGQPLRRDRGRCSATYSETGTGKRRYYLHNAEEAEPFGQEPGTFTPWEDLPADTRPAVLRGAARRGRDTTTVDVGAVPRPAHRRRAGRQPGVDPEDQPRLPLPRLLGRGGHRRHPAPDARLRALHLPAVLAHARELPARAHRRHVQPVRRARRSRRPTRACSSSGSATRRASTSRTCSRCCTTRSCRGPNTIVAPGGKMDLAMQLIFTPFIWRMAERRKKALATR